MLLPGGPGFPGCIACDFTVACPATGMLVLLNGLASLDIEIMHSSEYAQITLTLIVVYLDIQ
ncbi:hypothetical protein SAMN05421690_103123 [Nitrosomonas sp. Nm51]|nr:hypothetical protein SAMN05421690_103123 [Nitrosomonas sp. Nm51]